MRNLGPPFKRIVCCLVLSCAWSGSARDIHVSNTNGHDDRSGESSHPLRTIANAIRLAKAGDTIHLAPTAEPYREMIHIRDHSGEPGRPIVLDGHGAVVTGAEPLDPVEWKPVAPGRYRNDTFAASIRWDAAVQVRFFVLFDGHMQRMGRTSKKAPRLR